MIVPHFLKKIDAVIATRKAQYLQQTFQRILWDIFE
jgi:hypothetical protein